MIAKKGGDEQKTYTVHLNLETVLVAKADTHTNTQGTNVVDN